jgi:hydroxyacylglutathione hydrolase
MQELEIDLIPILEDNYVFLLQNKVSGKTALVDPGDAEPCLKSLKALGKQLDFILITHHHADHIGGIAELKEQFPQVRIYAPLENRIEIPWADFYLQAGEKLHLDGAVEFDVMGLPGHTLGHIAYYSRSENALFSGDVLFGLGCGRVFEGTYEMTFDSLRKIKKLPDETRVFCTHEYTMSNLRFVQDLIETNQLSLGYDQRILEVYKNELLMKRSQGIPSIPLNLGTEKVCNPMLFSQNAEEFARLREMRNTFKLSNTSST